MRDDKLEIDSATGLVTYCKSVNSPVKMNKRCAEVILANYDSRDISLYTDKEGNLYQTGVEGQEISTTLDDVIDEVCEWNYEDIEAAKQALKRADDYIDKCKLNSQIEKLEKESRSINYIFYQTKYGRNVEKLADRIAKDVMEQLNLVPIYDVPFYEDKVSDVPVVDQSQQTDKEEEVPFSDMDDVTFPDKVPFSDGDRPLEQSEEFAEMGIVASDPIEPKEEKPETVIEEAKGAR